MILKRIESMSSSFPICAERIRTTCVFKLIEIRFARTSYGVVFSRAIKPRKKGLGQVGETLGESNRRLFLHPALFFGQNSHG